jgi:hypothetical protein
VQVLTVLEKHVSQADVTRVRFDAGWMSATTSNGDDTIALLVCAFAKRSRRRFLVIIVECGERPRYYTATKRSTDSSAAAYTCVRRAMVRVGYEMDSDKIKILEAGTAIEVIDRKVTRGDCFNRRDGR